ncbi:MAG: LPS-assembly protein LptD [Usitatibacter sp.]
MKPRRIPALTFALVSALVAQPIVAQEIEGLRLKLEKQLRLAPTRPERDSAKFLEADHIQGEPDRNIIANGNVTLRQRGATIRADRVDYSGDDQTAVATGGVRLERDGDAATGPRLTYHLDKETGEMDSPTFEFPKTPERRTSSRGQAERALLSEGHTSRLFRAEYTSCPVPRDDWFIRVRELEIDGERNVGRAYNSTVYFLGMPILYSPYMSFALDNKRRSGFLAPTFGTSGKSGFEMALPYYWNIAENFDATVTPKVYTKRGLQLGGEFRYLEPKLNGVLESEFLPNDRIAEKDRYFLGIQHSQQLWHGWHAAVNAQGVSDDDYFRDLSTKIANTSQTNLPRDAILAYDDDVWSLSARALAYQTLQDPLQSVPIPYRIVPRLVASGEQQNFHGFDWQLFSELSNFRHPTMVNGQRAIAYLSAAMPFRQSYGYVLPKLGFHMTRYNLGENSAGFVDATRSLPIASVDAGLFFDRETTWGGSGFQQTLEPRVYYLNVPFRDQTQLPNFTTAEKDFNFAQLFTENRFVGGDRIGDANQLTVALSSRMVESDTGLERLRAALGQVHYFTPPRVTLGAPPPDSKSSDIIAFVSSQMAKSLSADASWQYTPNLNRSQKLTLAAHYTPEPGSILNAAYRYTRGTEGATDPASAGIKQIDLSTQWPITRNLSGLGRFNWSIKDRKVLEGLAGIEYNAGCWQVRAVAHRFITSTQQYSTSFQIQLELSGLSRIGINPLETIRQNISGYRRTDEITP